MKKIIFNSVIVVFLFFSVFSFNKNIAFAQKITCKIEKNDYTSNLFLFSYNDNNENEGYIWVHTFITEYLSDNDRQFLDQIDGQSIPEQDSHYNQLLTLTTDLDRLGYNSLLPFVPQPIMEVISKVFGVLKNFISK